MPSQEALAQRNMLLERVAAMQQQEAIKEAAAAEDGGSGGGGSCSSRTGWWHDQRFKVTPAWQASPKSRRVAQQAAPAFGASVSAPKCEQTKC